MRITRILLISALICLNSCRNTSEAISKVEAERLTIDPSIEGDSLIHNFIAPYREHLNSEMNSVLVYNPKTLNKSDGDLNTGIGNLMADIVMEQANQVFKARTGNEIDFVLLNFGGIRSELPKGNLTTRAAYKLMPFENEIVIAELSGKKVEELIKYLEVAKTAHPISGIQLKADKDYKIIDARIQGKKIDINKTYFVATSDYLQQGGDNMNFFRDPVNLYGADYKLRNAIIDYFTKIDTIKTDKDNRYTRD